MTVMRTAPDLALTRNRTAGDREKGQIAQLRNGTTALIRPIQATDRERIKGRLRER